MKEMIVIALAETGIFETLFAAMWFFCPKMDALEIIAVDFMLTFIFSWGLYNGKEGVGGHGKGSKDNRNPQR